MGLSTSVKKFISGLLTDCDSRMGYDRIISHSFLSDLDIDNIRSSEYQSFVSARLRPVTESAIHEAFFRTLFPIIIFYTQVAENAKMYFLTIT